MEDKDFSETQGFNLHFQVQEIEKKAVQRPLLSRISSRKLKQVPKQGSVETLELIQKMRKNLGRFNLDNREGAVGESLNYFPLSASVVKIKMLTSMKLDFWHLENQAPKRLFQSINSLHCLESVEICFLMSSKIPINILDFLN